MAKLKTRLLKDLPVKTTPITDSDYVINSNNGTTKLKVKDITKNLDQNVNKINNDIKEILEKGVTAETVERATKKEIERQIEDGTIANLTIAPESITKDKLNITSLLANPAVTFSGNAKGLNKLRYMIQFKTDGATLQTVKVKWGVTVKSGLLDNTSICCKLYSNATDNLDSNNYDIINMKSPIVSVTELNKMFTNKHDYVISGDKTPKYTIICLELSNVVEETPYEVEIASVVIEINGKTFPIHKHKPYMYDISNPVVFGDFNPNLISKAEVVPLVRESNKFVEIENLNTKVKDIVSGMLDNTHIPLINYEGVTRDVKGLFVVYLFDIRQLLDTDTDYVKNNPLTIQFISSNRTNTSGIGCQLYNNNNPSINSLLGGQMYTEANTITVPQEETYKFTRTYGLNGKDRYIRICLNFKWITKEETQTGVIDAMSVRLGDIDLTPFLVEIDGLSLNTGGHTIKKGHKKMYATTNYVDNKYEELNNKINNMTGGTGSGPVSKWTNKKWCAIGDSITEKNFRANKNYHDYIKELINCTVYNRGISGSGYQASNSIMNRISTFEADSDLITIFAGTNDYNHGTVPLGKIGDKTQDTLCGCIYLSFKGILDKFPTKTIAVFTPLTRSNCHRLNEVTNNRGYTLGQLVDCIKEIAHLFGFPVLDLYRESNLHPWIVANNTMYFAYQNDGVSNGDGLHPNDKGQKVIADKILTFINSL